MVATCWVPGCKTGYTSEIKKALPNTPKIHLFSAPKKESKLRQWQERIPCSDRILTAGKHRVCELHFEDHFILKDYNFIINGENVTLPRGNWTLTEDAIPTIFPNCPSYLTTRVSKRRDANKRRKNNVHAHLKVENLSQTQQTSSTIPNINVPEPEVSNQAANSWLPTNPIYLQPTSPVDTLPTRSVPLWDALGLITDNGKENEVVSNLSHLNLRQIPKPPNEKEVRLTTSLILDYNQLSTLSNLNYYKSLTKLSLSNNKIDSLIWFHRLVSLKILHLSSNKISNVHSLWKMCNLTHVDLSGNQIMVIDAYETDSTSNLEYLNFSNNNILQIGNLSMLSNLKELLLRQNEIPSLEKCKSNLPTSLTSLNVSGNSIQNLNNISELSNLTKLEKLEFKPNPCLNDHQLADSVEPHTAFDYRPYVFTWCPSLLSLDGQVVSPLESSMAVQLLAQGKIRETEFENQVNLITYLSEMCSKEILVDDASLNEGCEPASKKIKTKIVQLTLPKSNNANEESPTRSNKSGNHSRNTNNLSLTPMLPEHIKQIECSSSPCQHYIQFIEEKAKCHKLSRINEELLKTSERLQDKVEILENVLSQNGLTLNDLIVKVEVKEEIS